MIASANGLFFARPADLGFEGEKNGFTVNESKLGQQRNASREVETTCVLDKDE